MMRGSDSGAQKMKGINTHSPKLDSLEARETAILQQNWRGWKRWKSRGEIRSIPVSIFLMNRNTRRLDFSV